MLFFKLMAILLILGIAIQPVQAMANAKKEPAPLRFIADDKMHRNELDLTSDEIAFLQAHPVLKVANEADWPPFDFFENGKPTGLSKDYMDLVAGRLGVRVQYATGLSWTELLEAFDRGAVDVLNCIQWTQERSRHMVFTEPYYQHPNVLATLASRTADQDPDHLDGKTVAVGDGYSIMHLLAKRHPGVRLLPVKGPLEGLQAVQRGNAAAYCDNFHVIQYTISKHRLTGLAIGEKPVLGQMGLVTLRMAAKQKILAALLQKGLQAISREEREALHQKWIHPKDIATQNPFTLQEQLYLEDHPVLRVESLADYAPYNFIDNGQPQGFTIDYIRLLGDKIGARVHIIKGYTWEEYLQMAKDGRIDVVLDIVPTEERKKFLAFTDPYCVNIDAIVAKPAKAYQDLAALSGKTVAIPKAYFYEEIITDQYPDISLTLASSLEDCLKLVSFGQADATINDKAVLQYLMAVKGMSDLRVTGVADFGSGDLLSARLGIPKDHSILRDILDKAMKLVTPLEISQLNAKWLSGAPASVPGRRIVLTAEEEAYLTRKQKLVMCVNPNWMPFETIDNQRHKGIVADYMALFAERIGVPIELLPTRSWTESLQNAKNRKCDILSCAQETVERKQYLFFSRPYLNLPLVLATREDAFYVENPGSYPDKEFGVTQGYAHIESLKKRYPGIRLKPFATPVQGLKAVMDNQIFAFIGGLPTLGYQIKTHKFTNLKIGGHIDYEWNLGVAMRNDEPQLLGIFNKAVASLTPEEKNALDSKWMTVRYEQTVDMRRFWTWIAVILLISCLVVFIFTAWNDRLRKEVSKRIKAENEARKQGQLLELVVNHIPAQVFWKDRDLVYLGCNQAFAQTTGMGSIDQIVDASDRDFVTDPAQLEYFENLDHGVLESGKAIINIEESFVKPDGHQITVLTSKVPLRNEDDEVIGLLGISQDITERKQMEAELIVAKEKAEEGARAKAGFLARMSHEIRTPMNAIIGLCHLVLRMDLPDKQKDYVTKILSSAESLLGIINDILDFSKIEAGKLAMEQISFGIDQVLENVSNLIAAKAEEKGLALVFSIHPDVPQQLLGDPLRLGQVITNLTANAVKFTDNGEIAVMVAVAGQDPAKNQLVLDITVRDTGIGMTPDQTERLFDSFSQADESTTRKYGGTGLGLAICKRLVRLMHGDIQVQSRLGEGSAFSFTARFDIDTAERRPQQRIPDDLRHVNPPGPSGAEDVDDRDDQALTPRGLEAVKGARVLLVEDNEVNQMVAEEMLKIAGLQVDIAANGLESLKAVAKRSYDLILMDIEMPEMDGLSATREIRKWESGEERESGIWNQELGERQESVEDQISPIPNSQFPIPKHIPIIALSAHAMSGDYEKSLEAGMNGHISKPIDPAELHATLKTWIKPGPRSSVAEDGPGDETSERQAPSSDIPGFETAKGIHRLGGNSALYYRLLDEFAVKNQYAVEQIKALIAVKAFSDARRAVHAIKGVAGNLSGSAIFNAAIGFETALKQKDLPQIEPAFALFAAKMDQALKHILKCRDATPETQATAGASKSFQAEAARQFLQEIAHSLAQDYAAALEYMDELAARFAGSGFEDAAADLARLIDNFDKDDALAAIAKLMDALKSDEME